MKRQAIYILIAFSLCSTFVASQDCPRLCQCARRKWTCSRENITDEMLLEIARSGDPLTATALLLKNNKLTTFPAQAFVNFTVLTELDLGENLIKKVPRNLSTYIPSLRKVILNQNSLQSLGREDFLGYDNIDKLDLFKNNISALEPGVFKNLPKLTKLFVEQNMIKVLRKGVLSDLKELTAVSFHGNRLEEVEAGSFDGNKKLEQIWLRKNKLKSLPADLFKSLQDQVVFTIDLALNQLTNEGLPDNIFNSSLDEVILEDNQLTTIRKEWFGVIKYDLMVDRNPIKCDCYSYQAFQDLLNKDKGFTIVGTCATPSSLNTKTIKEVFSKNQVNCTSCSINSCKHNSTCNVLNKLNYACNCTDPYYGNFCQKINRCIPSPCLNNGNCTNLDGLDYNCTCQAEYEGKNCQVMKGEEGKENKLSPGYIVLIVLIVLALITVLAVVLYLRRRNEKRHPQSESAPLNKPPVA